MPCLNEAETLGICIDKAKAVPYRRPDRRRGADRRQRLRRRLQAIARAHGARVVPMPRTRLRRGADRRHPRGARPLRHHGRQPTIPTISPALEPFRREAARGLRPGDGQPLPRRHSPRRHAALHAISAIRCSRRIGRLFFGSAKVGDFHCGLRGFTRDAHARPDLRTDRNGVRLRDGGAGRRSRQVANHRGADDALARRPLARAAPCAPGATAGDICSCLLSSRRNGCSSIREYRS